MTIPDPENKRLWERLSELETNLCRLSMAFNVASTVAAWLSAILLISSIWWAPQNAVLGASAVAIAVMVGLSMKLRV